MPLSLKNISKTLNNRLVLKDVTLDVDDGEILGIFGSSGAGKSVLMDIIAGRSQPSEGIIEANGADVTASTADARGFSAPEPVDHASWRKLFQFETKPQMSDGEMQVLALKSLFEKSNQVLLLDNSFSGMDKITRDETFELLRQLVNDRKIPVIFASNDYEEILLLCDRIAVLVDGSVMQSGIPQKVYECPENAKVARLVDRSNLFTARRLTSSKAELPEYQTIEGAHRLLTRRVERNLLAPLNQNVSLSIKPEYVSISFGASFPEDNLLKATVARLRFLGPTTLIEFDADGLKLEALVLRVVGLSVGDECMVSLPPDRIEIFKN